MPISLDGSGSISGISTFSFSDEIIHTGDTNTAIKFPANDTISFETSGNERLRIDSSGDMGLGTSTIENFGGGHITLEVAGSTTSQGGVFKTATSDSAGTGSSGTEMIMFTDNTQGAINVVSSDPLTFSTANTERLRIGSNGYVNIGTGSAEQQLTVQNSAQHSLIRVISKNDSDAGIDFGDVDDTDRARIRYSNPTDSLSLNVNADTRVVIDSSGRVMIGGGSSPSQVGDGQLIVYSSDRLHPAIKCAGMINNYANGYSMLADNYTATESQMSLGLSYSSSALVLSRGVKVSGSQDDVYLSSQAQYATRPCAIRLDQYGNFIFLTTETNAATTVDTAVTLTNRFQIDRSGNIYQKPSGRNMYFGSGNNLRIGVQSNGDSNIEAVSGDLKFMDGGNVIFQMRSDGLEMKRDIYFGTAGMGIVLGNTSNVDANTLDDYEEGDFNGADISGGSLTLSYNNNGRYVKVGRQVYVIFDITYPSNSDNNLSRVSTPFSADLPYGGGWVGWNDLGRPMQVHVSGVNVYFMDCNSSGTAKHLYNNELSGKRIIGGYMLMTNS